MVLACAFMANIFIYIHTNIYLYIITYIYIAAYIYKTYIKLLSKNQPELQPEETHQIPNVKRFNLREILSHFYIAARYTDGNTP